MRNWFTGGISISLVSTKSIGEDPGRILSVSEEEVPRRAW